MFFPLFGATAQRGPGPPHFWDFLTTLRSIELLWMSDWHSYLRRDFFSCSFSVLCLYCFVLIVLSLPFVLIVQHNTNILTTVGIRTRNPASDRLQTLALDRWDRLLVIMPHHKYPYYRSILSVRYFLLIEIRTVSPSVCSNVHYIENVSDKKDINEVYVWGHVPILVIVSSSWEMGFSCMQFVL